VGFRREAQDLEAILGTNGFRVSSSCCKTGSVPKEDLGIRDEEKVRPGQPEMTCNPAAQAELLEEAGVELVLLLGQCVGHDSATMARLRTPVVCLVAKDRVLAHNTVAALYRAQHGPEADPAMSEEHLLRALGHVRSTLRNPADAPRMGSEGAPDAWLDLDPAYLPALRGLEAGAEVIVVTWLHRADRSVLQVHPRRDPERPLRGVFATRSPSRPNPLGFHRVTVREVAGARLRVGPIEAVDGTSVVDIKPVLKGGADG
jgi:tRNA-Thr(GGU) m(6)t(6)A37 methyltransferase TsaA